MRRKGFTLVEIMIVILIIGVLLGMAIPQWMKARESSRRQTCLKNLRRISDGKDLFAMENKLQNGDPVAEGDLWPEYIKGDAFPECPESGTYAINEVGTDPTCSVHMP